MTGICTCGQLRTSKSGTHMEDGQEVCNACHRFVEHTRETRAAAAVANRRNNYSLAQEADSLIGLTFGVGVGALILGVLVMVAAWPDGDDRSDSGNTWLALLGGGLAGVGQLAVLFAIIAWAVKFGIQASRRD